MVSIPRRDELVLRICQRLELVEAGDLERLRAASTGDDLLGVLIREGAIDATGAGRVEEVLARLQARLSGSTPGPEPKGAIPAAIEIGGMRFELTLDSDPYASLPVYRMRCQSFDRRVIFSPIPRDALLRRQLEERIARVKAKAPPEATRVYAIHDIGGNPHLLTACPEGAPLSIVVRRLRPDRARSLVLADSLLDVLDRCHRNGLVHGFLSAECVHLSTSGGLEISEFVRTPSSPPWAIAAGPVAYQPPASPRRDVFAAAFLLHTLLRLEPTPEALLATLADSPPPGLLADLLRTRNPSQSEVFLGELARALVPADEAVRSAADLRNALTGRTAPSPTTVETAPPGGPERRRRRLIPFLATIASLGATLTAPLWFGQVWAPADVAGRPAGSPGPLLAVQAARPLAPVSPPPGGGAASLRAPVDAGTPSYLTRIANLAQGRSATAPSDLPAALPARYDEAIRDFPDEPRVHFDRGRVLFRIGRTEEALVDLDAAIRLALERDSPADRSILYEAHLQRSLANYQLGRPERILDDLVRAREILPERDEAHLLLGRLYDRAGRRETASQLYQDALATGRETFYGHYHRGVSRFYRGDLGGAEEDLTRALEIGGDSSGPHTFLGRIRAEQGRTAEAIRSLEKAIELEPGSYEALFYLGRVHLAAGDADAAGRAFVRAVEADPSRAGAYNGLGLLESGAGRTDEALALFDKALAVQAEYAPALRNRASARFHRGEPEDVDRAIADLLLALRIEPDDTEALVLLGSAHAQKGDLAPALEATSRAIDLAPQNARAYYNRGTIYLRRKNVERGRNDLAQASDADPHYDLPRIALGQLALEAKDYDDALDWFQAAAKANPRSSEAYNLIGATHAIRGRNDMAIAAFDRALQIDPGDARVLGNRARCLARSHRFVEARRDYDQALQIDPDQSELAAERARVVEYLDGR